ncbi:MAG: hypothetical protein WCN95_13920, partial [bacterium]
YNASRPADKFILQFPAALHTLRIVIRDLCNVTFAVEVLKDKHTRVPTARAGSAADVVAAIDLVCCH